VKECAGHSGGSSDFPHDPIQRVVRSELDPMAVREPVTGQGLLAAFLKQFRLCHKSHGAQIGDDGGHLLGRRLAIFLGLDRLQRLGRVHCPAG